jgi:hypothetical protein
VGFSFGENPGATLIGGGAVLPGDMIEFNGGGQAAQVIPNVPLGLALLSSLGVTKSVYHPAQTAPSVNRTVLVLDRKLDRYIQAPNVLTPRVNYRIMRSPRPIPGEQPLPFPNGVFVIAADRTGFYFDPPTNLFTRVSVPDLTNAVNRDILFDPSGRVVGVGTEYFLFFVSDVKSALAVPADTNWALVTLYTRTGSVGYYPVDQQSGNPYTFAQFGRGGQ